MPFAEKFVSILPSLLTTVIALALAIDLVSTKSFEFELKILTSVVLKLIATILLTMCSSKSLIEREISFKYSMYSSFETLVKGTSTVLIFFATFFLKLETSIFLSSLKEAERFEANFNNDFLDKSSVKP